MTDFPEIVVIGSANVDLVSSVTSLPRPGETVLASAYAEYPGGKGANQAIAAARLGRRVAIVGRVGDDPLAEVVRGALAGEGVDVRRLQTTSGVATGRAFIAVDARAENSIVVVPGANAALTAEDVRSQHEIVAHAEVVVAQLEVPREAVLQAASLAEGRFVLNPAPAVPLEPELLAMVDVLVVNEGEFETVTGTAVPQEPQALVAILAARPLPSDVVITLGGRGAAVWQDGVLSIVPAPTVDVVDTTGAGDTFVGALADAMVRGLPLPEAARWAVVAASISTRSVGATGGMPRREQVAELMGPESPEPRDG
ncbi:MAG: ribokinase [Intrasporangium sp.]|uniref:ribokinase n=1 Tax=Intrasporangium sp. TaxID=1925024 RepID=UPI003F80A366